MFSLGQFDIFGWSTYLSSRSCLCQCLVRELVDMCKDNFIFLRARGGRDAEREERALWETPERKRSTKQLSNGRMNSEIDLSSWIWLDLLEMRRHYLGNRGENEGEIQQSENELTGQADPAEEPMEEEPVDDAPPPLEDIEQSEEEDEEEKEEEKGRRGNACSIPCRTIAHRRTNTRCRLRYVWKATIFLNDRFFCLSQQLLDIPFIRPPLQNVISRSSAETIFGNAPSKPIYSQTRPVHSLIASFRDDERCCREVSTIENRRHGRHRRG